MRDDTRNPSDATGDALIKGPRLSVGPMNDSGRGVHDIPSKCAGSERSSSCSASPSSHSRLNSPINCGTIPATGADRVKAAAQAIAADRSPDAEHGLAARVDGTHPTCVDGRRRVVKLKG